MCKSKFNKRRQADQISARSSLQFARLRRALILWESNDRLDSLYTCFFPYFRSRGNYTETRN